MIWIKINQFQNKKITEVYFYDARTVYCNECSHFYQKIIFQ